MESQEKQYKYYAFISYSRKNSKAAKYLHRQLEHFRVPVKYVAKENLPPHQKFLRPVFRDRRDLEVGAGSFTDDIKAAIEQTRYMIVLCSPEAANSHWVNEEIKHFLETHNNDHNAIVPVILNGEPDSGGDMECLPGALRSEEITMRNLPSMIPDEGDDEKTGWENGVVQAISYMLKVQQEKIKATVDAEKVRQAKIYAAIGIVATIVFALLAGWAFHAERQAAEQAEIAEGALNFLTGMFQSTDPTGNGNKDLKVLDAIRAKIPEIKNIKKWQLKSRVAGDIGLLLNRLGEYPQAQELQRISLELNLQHRKDSVELANCYNNIATVYGKQGKYDQALEYYQKALKIRLKKLGANHPDVATCYNNIAIVYKNQGKYDQALEYYQKALKIRLKKLGADHPDVAMSYNNIVNVYNYQGKYDQALEYYQKALAIYLKKLGANHPDVAMSYSNIAMVYGNQGKYDQALEYSQKALAIRLKKLEADHPSVAMSYNNIANVYYSQGKYDQALEYLQKALAIYLKKLGADHPSVAMSYLNIGLVYALQEKLTEAESSTQRAVDIARKTSGEQHPDTQKCIQLLKLIREKKNKK